MEGGEGEEQAGEALVQSLDLNKQAAGKERWDWRRTPSAEVSMSASMGTQTRPAQGVCPDSPCSALSQ